MSDLKMALIKKYGAKAKDGGYSVDTAALNKINRILHAYHVRFGYSKGKRPKISKTKRKRIYMRDKGICAYCGCHLKYKPNGFHIDHIVPLAHGGNNEDDNLTLSCASCNESKKTKLIKPRFIRGVLNGTKKNV